MIISNIEFSPRFTRRLEALPDSLTEKAEKTIILFRNDPFHPSLRFHKLSGKLKRYWSVSIDRKNRIILSIEGDTAFLHSVGPHAIYEKM